MSHQNEAIVENDLIRQLSGMGYAVVQIHDGEALLYNLQAQLETFNKTKFTAKEFDAILNHLANRTRNNSKRC